MKKLLAAISALTLSIGLLASCSSAQGGSDTASTTSANAKPDATTTVAATGEKEVLEFYHGYFHAKEEWAPAATMREIYDEFAAQNAGGPVEFKPIPVENGKDIMNNKVSGGSFPDVIDLAGTALSQAAISQKLVYDMKPYIETEKLQDAVGLNYTQNVVDGAIYTVHDQLLTIGLWYNEKILKDTGAALPDTWKTWDDFGKAMATVRDAGKADGIYAYGAGQGSTRCFNAALALSEDGKKMLVGELTPDMINSATFADAFTTVAALDQANGSQNTSNTANDFAADFNAQKSGIFFNGVWAAGGFGEQANFQPAIYPGNVALASAGSGICIADGMSEAKTKLALDFMKYMTSEAVQKRIFSEVGANPCNNTLDLAALATDPATKLLAKACAQANSAGIVVPTIDAVWGVDVNDIISAKFQESAVTGTDIKAKLAEVQKELIAVLS